MTLFLGVIMRRGIIFLIVVSMCSVAIASLFRLQSPEFQEKQTMPKWGGCYDAGMPPALFWTGAPNNTREYALIVTDYDAVRVSGQPVVHWIVIKLPAGTHEINGDSHNLVMGKNFRGQDVFLPFCPPDRTHQYTFVLYALDSDTITYPESPNDQEVLAAIEGHVLDQATLVGEFSPKS